MPTSVPRSYRRGGGLDLRMFRNRLGVDLAYYNNTSKDLIVNMPVSSASV